MPTPARKSVSSRWLHLPSAACLGALGLAVTACKSPKNPGTITPAPAEEITPAPSMELAGARVDLAKQAVVRNAPEEALALLVSAVESDPSGWEALRMAQLILEGTRWFLPEAGIGHGPVSIQHVEMGDGPSLWAAVSIKPGTESTSTIHTVVRWDLAKLRIEAVLFPVRGDETSFMRFDPTHQYAVIKRSFTGRDETVLLCDAKTLKPIREIGPWPALLTPQAALVFSADGLLLAHPGFVSATDRSVVWHLRDSKSGEIIRSSSPTPPDKPAPLAAFLDRLRLRVLHADGTLLDMPVSPVEPEVRSALHVQGRLSHACFSTSGTSVDALPDPLPGQPPRNIAMSLDGSAASDMGVAPTLEVFPWSTMPNIWNGLFREANRNPLKVDQTRVTFPALPFPSHDTNSAITSVALCGDRVAIGGINGTLTIQQALPFPTARPCADPTPPRRLSPAEVLAFSKLAEALAGNRYDPLTRSIVRLETHLRLKAAGECDFGAIGRMFPILDFSALRERMAASHPQSASEESLIPLWQRLASADSSGATWPVLLEMTRHLSSTPWHQDLLKAVEARKSGTFPAPESTPWLAPLAVERVFADRDEEAILETIRKAGGNGPAAAKALELSLASEHPEWIRACLDQAEELPPFLRQLALSRIAWLEDRKADALGVWPDTFPDLERVRHSQDWDGWEQADFHPAYQDLHRCMSSLLAELEVPADATEERRKEVAERLEQPETLKAVGRTRFAKACIKAALEFSKFKEEKETTFRLAALARGLGEAPEPCLRAEAMALTALGDYQQAHDRWIRLITEHPVTAHEPGDYAEAAYTAFENSDPQQAMVILTTGLHRFPGDANFALRAGWVALLTGNADRAYRFLLSGRQSGFPAEKKENATALLAIAAAQSGATEDAAVFYQDLIAIDPDWRDPATIETLEWPEELKAALRELSAEDLPL